ncbi:hypothetical protein F5I97DRAFT_1961874 [Phlebopus sp. FC_14]|nr:hypothetical protein F5I97DRAFT_1961874 [Phlebopus sp. FC_14]
MMWSASVLSTASSDTEPAILVTFDSAKYLFNVGENTTRCFMQSTQNWKKTKAVFLTSAGTQRASGLPGLLMTFADAGHAEVNITGPSGLLHLLASMRKYVHRENLIVSPTEVSIAPPDSSNDDPVYKDGNISIFAFPVLPERLQPEPVSPELQDPDNDRDTTSFLKRKRKREDPPDRPSKRSSNTSCTSSVESLKEHMNEPDFDPMSLTGEVAQEWRRFLIRAMFPATNVTPVPPPHIGRKKRKGWREATKNAKPSVDPPLNKAHSSQLNRPLPPLEYSLVGSADPSHKPTMAYAIVGPRVRGKFDADKALALGLKRGPLRSQLIKGQTVTIKIDDGKGNTVDRIIKPEDCIGEGIRSTVVLILDTPTLEHIPGLLSGFFNSGPFAKYRWKESSGPDDHIVRAVFHLCGDGVLEDDQYKSFMNEFGPETHHIIASRKHLPNPVSFTSVAYSQLRLNQLDPDIFPIHKFACKAEKNLSDIVGLPASIFPMRANMSISMHPPRSPTQLPDTDKPDLFHPAVISSSPLGLPAETKNRFMMARAVVQGGRPPQLEGMPGEDVTVCTLGTSSAMPSLFRNLSGTLIHIPNHGYILLDAGEGSWGQLARKFGEDPQSPSNVWQVLRQLRCVYISHMHADHHAGLPKILAMRQRLDPPEKSPLYVVAGRNVPVYLREYSALEDLGFEKDSKSPVIPISVEALHYQFNGSSSMNLLDGATQEHSIIAASDLCNTLGLQSLRTVDVIHQTPCYGVVISHTDGWSIVYSGDTVPTYKLAQAGEGATLLIHEATMADDEMEMARAKMHSTVGQAIEIGQSRMKARNVLLTHFSGRYPTMPPSAMRKRRNGDPVVALAFDHANIKIGNMWKMNAYMKAIEQSFVDLVFDEEDLTQIPEVDIE